MKAIVLAAGKGTRLRSEQEDLPKALRKVNGKPLIRYVLDNLNFLEEKDIAIVVGFLKEKVISEIGGDYRYVEQLPPLNGTAKATLAAESIFPELDEPVLVCYCDMPFLSRETYRRMFDVHIKEGAGNTVLAGKIDPPPPFGRLIWDDSGKLVDIIEDSACTPEQCKLDVVNVGIQVLDGKHMWGWLKKVDNDNPKQEYYLTGLVRVLAMEDIPQAIVMLEDHVEMLGVNTMEDLETAESLVNAKKSL